MPTSPEMDALTAQVEANGTVVGSAVTFINGVAAQILAAAGDKAQSIALANTLKSQAQSLSEALVANTPSA